MKYTAYYCTDQGNWEAVIAGKFVEVVFFRKQWVGYSLSLEYFRIKAVKEGIKRVLIDGGTQQKVHSPL